MGVNKVIYGGRTVLDITDSTVTPSKVLSGAIGYGADGERFTGTLVISDPYTKARRVDITLPASGWIQSEQWTYDDVTDSDGAPITDSYGTVVEGAVFDEDASTLSGDKYTQRVAANVTATDHPFVQCVLSENYELACNAMDWFSCITSLQTFNGYIVATFENSAGLGETPDIDLVISLLILDGASEASMAAVQRAVCKSVVATLSSSKWITDGYVYKQTVTVEIAKDTAVIGDGLFSIELETALAEIQELAHVTDIVVSNGSITAVCHNVDGKGPPAIDLQITLKVFELKE